MLKHKTTVTLVYLVTVLLSFLLWWLGWEEIDNAKPDKFTVYPLVEKKLLNLELSLPLRRPLQPSDRVIVVSFGEDATRIYGPLPWPRDVFAELIARLRELGCKTIVMDPLFADPQLKFLAPAAYRSLFPALDLHDLRIVNPHNYVGELARKLADKRRLIAQDPPGQRRAARLSTFDAQRDALLALSRHIARGDASLAFESTVAARRDIVFPSDFSNAPQMGPSPQRALHLLRRHAISPLPDPQAIARFDHVLTLYPRLLARKPIVGVNEIEVNPAPGLHFIKDARALVRFEDGVYASSMVRAVAHFLDVPLRVRQRAPDLRLVIGSRESHLEPDGRFPLAYYRQRTFPRSVSAIEVLRGRVPSAQLAGKLAIIDIRNQQTESFLRRATPIHGERWVSDLKATFASNLLRGHRGPTIERPPPMRLIEGTCIWLLGSLFVWLAFRAPLWQSMMAGLGLLALVAVVNLLLLVPNRTWLAAGILLFEIPLLMLSSVVVHYLIQRGERRRLRRAFGLYLPEPVLEHMLQDEHALKLGGQRRNLSILFCDIRHFTSLSENAPAEALGVTLNAHLTALTRVVFEQRGTLDKYMGDCVMAFFGAPVAFEDHALCALRAALRMQRALHSVQPLWRGSCGQEIQIGVGIATGDVVVGNMGSERLFDYTVVGDTVNLASRLEGLTKLYGVDVLVAEPSWHATKDAISYLEVDLVRVKGKQQPVRVFEAISEGPADPARARYDELCRTGLRAYRTRDWPQAAACFEQAARLRPNARLPQLYADRIERLVQDPPPGDWDGVSVFDTK